jgi:hypothetical protein
MAKTATARKAKPSTSGSTLRNIRPASVAAFPSALIEAKPTEATLDFDAAVAEAKAIFARMDASSDAMRIGELAAGVEKSWGENKLKEFAKKSGIPTATVARYRSVYRAWAGNQGPAPVLFAVAQRLQAHPDRFAIARENPNMTKAQACAKMREFHRDEEFIDPIGHKRARLEKWWKDVRDLAREAQDKPAEICGDDYPILRERIDPKLITNLKNGGRALLDCAEELETLFPDFFGREFTDETP